MDKSKNFLEFVTQNPPPCVPGQRLFWFDDETGEIRLSDTGVDAIVLDDDWKWAILDRAFQDSYIIPNEDPYYCVTKEDAKKFRDNLGTIKYVILKACEDGDVKVEEVLFRFMKVKTLDVTQLNIDECYIDYLLDHDDEVVPGVAIWFGRSAYIVNESGARPDCMLTPLTKTAKGILEDAIEDEE